MYIYLIEVMFNKYSKNEYMFSQNVNFKYISYFKKHFLKITSKKAKLIFILKIVPKIMM